MNKRQEDSLREIDKRWNKEVDKRADEDRGSYMPKRMEMTRKELDAHKDNMGRKQRRKMVRGLPLYRGAKIKVIG